MEPEIRQLRDEPLVRLGGARECRLEALLADLPRGASCGSSTSVTTYDPAGRSCAPLLDAPPEPRARSRRRRRCGTSGRPAARGGGARRRRSRRAAPRRRGCCPRSRPCARAARASGSRTTPRRSRACGGAPRRPSRRASARDRCRRPARSPAVRSGRSIPPPPARASARAAAPGRSCTIEATSAASAPAANASARCRASPAPPDAITGTSTVRRDLPRQLQVVAVARAVRVDRGHEQLAGARCSRLRPPTDVAESPAAAARRA